MLKSFPGITSKVFSTGLDSILLCNVFIPKSLGLPASKSDLQAVHRSENRLNYYNTSLKYCTAHNTHKLHPPVWIRIYKMMDRSDCLDSPAEIDTGEDMIYTL